MTKLEQDLVQFLADHESVVINALDIHVRDMTEVAKDAQASYEKISKNPAAAALQDQSMMTTSGLRMSAELFRDSAKRAQKALDALEALAGQAEELS
jgi:hypothetical protein